MNAKEKAIHWLTRRPVPRMAGVNVVVGFLSVVAGGAWRGLRHLELSIR